MALVYGARVAKQSAKGAKLGLSIVTGLPLSTRSKHLGERMEPLVSGPPRHVAKLTPFGTPRWRLQTTAFSIRLSAKSISDNAHRHGSIKARSRSKVWYRNAVALNVLALLTIPAIIGPLIPGDSEYTWWIPWALGIAVTCFFWFYVRPRRRRKFLNRSSTSRRSEPQTAMPGEGAKLTHSETEPRD
jgi:hypothetical protein